MTRRSPVSIGAIRPETGAHSDGTSEYRERAALFRGLPGVPRAPTCMYTPVSHAAAAVSHRSAITDQDHRLRSSRSRHARGRAAARRGTRRARNKPRSIDFIGAGGGDLGSQPASAHALYGNGSGFWKFDRCASRAARAFPRETRSACTHDVDPRPTLAAPLLKRAHTRAGHGVAP